MSSFLLNLAQRGAGLEPVVAAQPATTPYFAPDPGVSYTTQPESPPIDESFVTDPRTVRPEGAPVNETKTPDVTAPTRAPLVERSRPRYSAQPQTDIITTAYERESRPDEANRSDSRPEPISNPRRDPQRASPPVNLHVEETSPSSLTSGPEAGPDEPQVPTRVMPRLREMTQIKEIPRLEAAVNGEPDTSVPETTPSGRSADSRARLAPVRPADRSHTSPGAFDEVETFPVETPAVVQPSPIIQQERSIASTLLEKAGAPPPVQVRIGTVEVRAVTPPTTPPPGPQPAGDTAPGGFDDYAMIRSYVSWGRR